MVKKLVSRSEFARMAGVRPSAITKVCNSILKASTEGKRIDAAHPVSVEYLAKKAEAAQPAPAIGIDVLYEPAVLWTQEHGKYTTSGLQRRFKIGYNRAKIITDTMRAANILNIVAPPPPSELKQSKSFTGLRGHAAKNEQKKRGADQDDNQIYEVPDDIQAFADMTLRDLVEKFGTDVRFVDWLKATKAIEDINEKRLKNAQTKGELVSRSLIKLGIIDPINSAHIKLLTDGAKTIARRATAMHSAGRPLEDVEKFVIDQITSFIRPVKSKVARALRDV